MGEAHRRKLIRQDRRNWLYWSKHDVTAYIRINIQYNMFYRTLHKLNVNEPEILQEPEILPEAAE